MGECSTIYIHRSASEGSVMAFPNFLRRFPERLATGAYVLHTGIEKWSAGEERASGVHAMATVAYAFLGKLKPATLLELRLSPR
jgi:hypothetical protein